MTSESDASQEADQVPTMECENCEVDVPAGAFCGLCGTHLTREPGDGPHWLRPRNFGVAPGESMLRPSIASSLFPHLPQRARMPFRLGLGLVFIGLVTFAFLRIPAALITVAALGLPLLYLLYLSESNVYRDIPRYALLIAGGLGAAFGVGWVLVTGEIVAQAYGVPMAAGLALRHLLQEGLVIPVAGMLLMVIPPTIVRLLRPSNRESLDGFAIGMLAALAFTAGATLTRLAPQFATGLIAHSRPVKGLVVEAGIAGITVPLTGAVAGGLVGIALWFTGQKNNPHERPGRIRAMLIGLSVLVLAIHASIGVIDIIGVPQIEMLILHLMLAILSLLALRFALQIALLHEAHDPIQREEPLLCVHCEHVVPDMAFCPACGVATRASSRWSRHERRESRPVRQPKVVEGS